MICSSSHNTADCGDPPTATGLGFVTSGPIVLPPSATSAIANRDAMATYSCTDTTLTLVGSDVLTCTDVGGSVVQWSPELPVCQPGKEGVHAMDVRPATPRKHKKAIGVGTYFDREGQTPEKYLE